MSIDTCIVVRLDDRRKESKGALRTNATSLRRDVPVSATSEPSVAPAFVVGMCERVPV